MNSQILNKKIELIQWLSTIEDQSIIEKLIEFRRRETKDWWEGISDSEKKSIEKGIKQANNSELKDHSKMRESYERWL